MSCFIGEFKKLMQKYDMSSISIVANIDDNSALRINEYERTYNERHIDEFLAHKPNQKELEELFENYT